MTREKKLIAKFLSKPKDFTYEEMKKMLGRFGYREMKGGKASGSRVAFLHEGTGHIIRLHKPHPKNILKRYQLDFIEDELKRKEILK
jgi:hypothetical protein